MPNPSSQYTTNLKLEKIYEGTSVDNDLFNDNFDKIDAAFTAGSGGGVNADKVDGHHIIVVADSLPSTVTNGALCFVYTQHPK